MKHPNIQHETWEMRDEYEFLPAHLDVMHKPPVPQARVTALLLTSFLLAVLFWSIVGRLDIHASALGRLMVSSHSKIIQPLDRGEISVINVRDGQKVKKGDVLIELQTVDVQAEFERIMQQIQFLALESSRLNALLSDNPIMHFQAPALASESAIKRARLQLSSEVTEIQISLEQLDAKLQVNSAEQDANRKELDALQALKNNIDKRVNARQVLLVSQSISRIELLEQEKELLDVQRTIASLSAEEDVRVAEYKEIKEQKRRFLAQKHREYYQKLNQVEIEQAQAKQELIKVEERLRRRVLRAPVDGVVQQLNVHTLGGVVTPAQALMVIVPAHAELEAEINVLNKDIGFVIAGQSAEIKIDSFPFTKYGTINGRLLYISQDAVQDETLGLVFPARVQLARSDILVGDKLVQLSAGMSVIAEIKTSQRRVIEYLLSPLQQYQSEALRER